MSAKALLMSLCQKSRAAHLQVRTMRESKGEVTEAGPSIAVQMVGLNAVPVAGDEFSVCSTEQEVQPLSRCRLLQTCVAA